MSQEHLNESKYKSLTPHCLGIERHPNKEVESDCGGSQPSTHPETPNDKTLIASS